MNKKLNLCEILKDCPKGTKFYSPLFGDVSFVEIKEGYWIEVSLSDGITATFTCDGRYYDIYGGECVLFPSKEQRDWSKWKCQNTKFDPKTLQPFDKVIVKRLFEQDVWRANLISMVKGDYTLLSVMDGEYYELIIPYNDDTKHLIGTTEEAPKYYRYWED